MFLILLFHFIVTEMKEDTVNSNAMYMVEIENVYVSRNDMLKSIFVIDKGYFSKAFLFKQKAEENLLFSL